MNMDSFEIVTDSLSDLSDEYLIKNNVNCLYLSCLLDGKMYDGENKINISHFYERVRLGANPTTSQVNPTTAKNMFLNLASRSKKILYIACSSGLSGTYQSGHIGALEAMEENPELEIVVIDSLSASLGQGLLVNKAVSLRDSGKSFEETCKFIKEHVLNLIHVFTVDDLNHLYRGGRISKTTAVLGSMIGIKPMLHVDDEGHLVSIGKSRGRKKSIMSLVDMMEERIGSFVDKNDVIYISHGDCLDDAKLLAKEVENRFGYSKFVFDYVGPVVGAHSGPGTLALFFFGDRR